MANVFVNQNDEKFLVSIPLNNQISSLMTPLLFYELRMQNYYKGIIKLRSWWKCSYIPSKFNYFSSEQNYLYILKDKYDNTLKDHLKSMLYTRKPIILDVYNIVQDIFYQFLILHKNTNGFLHGNLVVENIALRDGKVSMINLMNSSFFVNGYRFYTNTHGTLNEFAINQINSLYEGIQFDDDLNEFFYMLIQQPPTFAPITGFIQSLFVSGTFGSYDMFTELFPKLNLTNLDILNILLVQNNTIASLPGSYDVYSFLCSLYSNDFMYIYVMKPKFSRNGIRKGICEQDKYNINREFCEYRNKLAKLWESIWFPEEVVDATKKILHVGRERKALNDIVSINAFIQPFRLKIDIKKAFKLFGFTVQPNKISKKNNRIITTRNGNLCRDEPKKNKCNTLFEKGKYIFQKLED